MHFYILCAFISCFPAVPDAVVVETKRFLWPKGLRSFDFVVGVEVDKKPVGIGTRVSPLVVVTSANPIEQYLTKVGPKDTDYEDKNNKISLYAMYRTYTDCTRLFVLSYSANISDRNNSWIKMGFDKTHSPIHDLVLVFLRSEPAHAPLPRLTRTFHLEEKFVYVYKELTFAGFGYATKEHTIQGNDLRFHVYDSEAEVDCDEFIPRVWGRFICILNVKNVYGVQSGAPLLTNKDLRGIGSFAMTKGNESILVFTDYNLYRPVVEEHRKRLVSNREKWPYVYYYYKGP